MSYGTPIAIASTHLDYILCVSCANIALPWASVMGLNDEQIYWKVRDLDVEEVAHVVYGDDEGRRVEDEERLANAVYNQEVADPFAATPPEGYEPAKLKLLQEGYYPDQVEINHNQCLCCGKMLHEFCTHYGPGDLETESDRRDWGE